MHSIVKTDLGSITIDNDVIGRLAGLTAMECYGVVGMAAKSIRDGLVHLLKIESLTKGVRVKVTEKNDLLINLHIIVEYGTNIVAITNTLIENVKYKVETCVGLTVREVNIFVESIRV